jgi:hypothetical protein
MLERFAVGGHESAPLPIDIKAKASRYSTGSFLKVFLLGQKEL